MRLRYGVIAVGVMTAVLNGCVLPGGVTGVDDKSGPAPAHIKDSGPSKEVDVSHVPNALPRHEMVKLAGNKSPYTVRGKTYRVKFDTAGFTQTGFASWYGNKFHGRKTSNGETYDMYGMSAAHKTLPIPCYVKVTNLSNNKEVVVRVNDRGPFHSARIIDLSYTAAKKLGFHNKGTSKVKIDIVDTSGQAGMPKAGGVKPGTATAKQKNSRQKHSYLQLGAFSQRQSAEGLKARVKPLTGYPILIRHEAQRNLYKVYVGPLLDNFDLLSLRKTLEDKNLAQAHVVEM